MFRHSTIRLFLTFIGRREISSLYRDAAQFALVNRVSVPSYPEWRLSARINTCGGLIIRSRVAWPSGLDSFRCCSAVGYKV